MPTSTPFSDTSSRPRPDEEDERRADEEEFGDARVVLRTAVPSAFFRVMLRTLAGASPIFRVLFRTGEPQPLRSLPIVSRPPSPATKLDSLQNSNPNPNVIGPSDERSADGLPVIRLTEDAGTLDVLLRLLYGISENGKPERRACDIDGIKGPLLAAYKYEFKEIEESLCGQLLSDLAMPLTPPQDADKLGSADGHPKEEEANTYALRVYALACLLGRAPLAEAAAYESLRSPIAPPGTYTAFPELAELPALEFVRLQDYHARAGEAVARIFEVEMEEAEKTDDEASGTEIERIPSPYSDLTLCQSCSPSAGKDEDEDDAKKRKGKEKAAWWLSYVSRAAPIVRSVPRSQMIFSDPVFIKEMYEVAEKCPGDCRTQIDARWLALSLILKERIDTVLGKVELDFGSDSNNEEHGDGQGKVSKLYQKLTGNG